MQNSTDKKRQNAYFPPRKISQFCHMLNGIELITDSTVNCHLHGYVPHELVVLQNHGKKKSIETATRTADFNRIKMKTYHALGGRPTAVHVFMLNYVKKKSTDIFTRKLDDINHCCFTSQALLIDELTNNNNKKGRNGKRRAHSRKEGAAD